MGDYMVKGNTTKNKKVILGVLFLTAAFIILFGSMFAYFSDIVIGKGDATAGTLDIQGNFMAVLNQGDTFTASDNIAVTGTGGDAGKQVATVTNFNPGDCILFYANVENVGSKSAWLRSAVSFSTVENGIGEWIKMVPVTVTVSGTTGNEVYTPSRTCASIRSIADNAWDTNNNFLPTTGPVIGQTYGDTTPLIIDGDDTITGYEAETLADSGTATGAVAAQYIGDNESSIAFIIYFDKWADNDAQGKRIVFEALVEALQFRNNPTPGAANSGPGGTGTVWDTVVSSPFTYTP